MRVLEKLRSSRVSKNLLAVCIGRGVMAFRQLAIVPVLIHAWGISYYGEWLTLTAIPAFLSMSNLGVGTAASVSIAADVGGDRLNAARRTFIAAGVFQLAIGAVCVLLVLVGLDTRFGEPIKGTLLESPRTIICLSLAAAFVRLATQAATGWWIGSGAAAGAQHQSNLFAGGELVITTVIPLCGGRAEAIAIAIILWTVAWAAWFVWLTATRTPLRLVESTGQLERDSWRAMPQLLRVGIGHQLSLAWQAILFQGFLVLASTLFGPATAALWGSVRVIARCGNQALEIVSQAVGAELQFVNGRGESGRIRELHAEALTASFILAALIAIALYFLGSQFFTFWTSGSMVVPREVWLFMAVGLLPYSLWWVSGEVLRSLNLPWAVNLYAVGFSVLALVVVYSLSPLGLLALAAGSAAFDFAMVLVVLPTTLKVLNDRFASCVAFGASSLIRKSLAFL